MKAIIYIRVSSDEQVKGTSLDYQEEICRKYCKEKNIEVLEVFREEGASAKSTKRVEFLRAIEYCRKNKGKVQAFVVAKVDRFARNTEDHYMVRKVLKVCSPYFQSSITVSVCNAVPTVCTSEYKGVFIRGTHLLDTYAKTSRNKG